ncbi:MAG TPA: YihY/virulence factor BrkB family protein [Acidobacteriota bacterium]
MDPLSSARDSDRSEARGAAGDAAQEPAAPAAPKPKRARRAKRFLPSLSYLFSIESHVYAFSIAANVLLSFFPFMVLILSITRNLLQWHEGVDVILIGLRDLLPDDPGLFDFVERNLLVAVRSRKVEALSLVLLVLSSNGIFIPLEVAFNRLWGFKADRNYVRSQLISFCLALSCGVLALAATVLTSASAQVLQEFIAPYIRVPQTLTLVALKLAAFPISIITFLLVYWILPNGKVRIREVLPVAVVIGITIELAKVSYVTVWPLLDFRRAYGPFFISVTLLLWGFIAAMIVLAGGELAARGRRPRSASPER